MGISPVVKIEKPSSVSKMAFLFCFFKKRTEVIVLGK